MTDPTDASAAGVSPAPGEPDREAAPHPVSGPAVEPATAPGDDLQPGPQSGPQAGPGREIDWREAFRHDPGLAGVLREAAARLEAAARREPGGDPGGLASAGIDRADAAEAPPTEDAAPPAAPQPPPPAAVPPADMVSFGTALGFSPQELAAVRDPREIRVLRLAMIGGQALAQAEQARANAQRFGGPRPPIQVGGRGHPAHLSDQTTTDAWMQARFSQLRKKARR